MKPTVQALTRFQLKALDAFVSFSKSDHHVTERLTVRVCTSLEASDVQTVMIQCQHQMT